MKVLNVHSRLIKAPKQDLLEALSTLSSKNDRLWPKEKWPSMNLDKGLALGSQGGHGPIGYKVVRYHPEEGVEFEFLHPKGFKGTHRLDISATTSAKTEIKHTIDMQVHGLSGILGWLLAIRWLHDALIEDAFDKVQHQLSGMPQRTPWSFWVRLLRFFLT
ncbi:MAG: hypothetical protein AAFY71_10355 [Bacteroidota bacterium]